MNQDERKTAARRMMLLIAAAGVIIGLYGFRLIFLQLVNGDSFKAQATNTTDYKFTVTAARGDIVDSKGERIASSVTGYNVVLNKLLMGDENLDALLQKLVGLLGENGESWSDSLLIGQADAAGHYAYTAESDNAAEQRSLAAMKENLGLQQYATADDVMEKLVEDYDLAGFSLYSCRRFPTSTTSFWRKTSARPPWPPSRRTASPCRAWRSWRRAPAATSRAPFCPMCWAGWARSQPKSGR